MRTLRINNVCYAININRLIEWMDETDNGTKAVQTSVTEVWAKPTDEDEKLSLVSKELTDVNSDGQIATSRHDVIMSIFDVVTGIGYQPDGTLKSLDDMTIGEKLCFNTLILNEVIYEINTDEQ